MLIGTVRSSKVRLKALGIEKTSETLKHRSELVSEPSFGQEWPQGSRLERWISGRKKRRHMSTTSVIDLRFEEDGDVF